jgi:Cd2+/Zn2+-exporting ATPase
MAKALVAEAEAQKIAVLPAQDVAILSGRGVTGVVNGTRVTVASHPYFDLEVPHKESVCKEADRLSQEGKTVMMVCHEDQVCSVFAVADTPRADSREMLADLKALGHVHTVMLTGDNPVVAEAIARMGGSTRYVPGCCPKKRSRRSVPLPRKANSWPWSATGSTTRPHWRRPPWALRWAGQARHRPWRPPTWC